MNINCEIPSKQEKLFSWFDMFQMHS